MIHLIDAEVASLRYRSRTVVAIVMLLVAGLLIPMSWMNNARPIDASELAQTQGYLTEIRSECPDCTLNDYLRYVWSFNDVIERGVTPFVVVLAFAVLVTVVVYVGSDFTSGALWTRLTFTPRRTPLLVARVLVCGLLGAAMMALAVVTTVVVSAIWFVALRGFDSLETDVELLRLIVAAILYGAFIGMIGALCTFMMNGPVGAGVLLAGAMILSLVAEFVGVNRPMLVTALSPFRQQQILLTGLEANFYMGVEAWPRTAGIAYHVIVIAILFAVTAYVFRRRDLKF